MYLIKHSKNYNYYSKKISKNFYHFVYSEKEAHKFRSKYEATKVLKKFKKIENYELIKL